MLHAPDFLGYTSAIELARDMPDLVAQALELKKIGNELMSVVGGREVHPINVKVGGWYRTPRKRELAPLVEKLERAREIALEAVRVTAASTSPTTSRTTSSSRSTRPASTRSTAAASSRTAASTSPSPSTTSTSSRSTSPGRTRSTRR